MIQLKTLPSTFRTFSCAVFGRARRGMFPYRRKTRGWIAMRTHESPSAIIASDNQLSLQLTCVHSVKKYACAAANFVFCSGDVLYFPQSMKIFGVNLLYRGPLFSNDEESVMESLCLPHCCLCQRCTLSERRTNRKSVQRKQFFGVNHLGSTRRKCLHGSFILFKSFVCCSIYRCLTAVYVVFDQRKRNAQWRGRKCYNDSSRHDRSASYNCSTDRRKT